VNKLELFLNLFTWEIMIWNNNVFRKVSDEVVWTLYDENTFELIAEFTFECIPIYRIGRKEQVILKDVTYYSDKSYSADEIHEMFMNVVEEVVKDKISEG